MEVITIIFAILAIVLASYYLLLRKLTYFKDRGVPHMPPVPLFGNFAASNLYRTSIVEQLVKIYKFKPEAKYVGMYLNHTPVFLIRDPELVKAIGVKNFEHFPNHRNTFDNTQDPLVSKNLISLRGQRWREVRSLLSPSFTAAKIKAMFILMTNCAENFSEFLARQPSEKHEMDMKDIFTRFTNDVIASCAFGIQVDSMKNPNNEFFKNGSEATSFSMKALMKLAILTISPKLAKKLGVKFVDKKQADFFTNTFKEIIETREKTGTSRPDMLQLMMDSRGHKEGREDLTIDDMVSQAFIFFFAGFETTSSLLCFGAREITTNPEVQEKLQQEIDQVLEDTSGEVTYEAVNGMKYLEAVIYETLRMYPGAIIVDRECDKEFELPASLPGLKPVTVEKGISVWFPTFAIQRDPKYYDQPDKFLPERFLDDVKSHNSATFLPFGIGPRMCIGNRFAFLEAKVLFFYLLARCDLKPSPKMKNPIQWSKSRPMFPVEGFWLQVVPRTNQSPFIQSSENKKSL